MTILDQTLNFWYLYRHAMGKSEVPQLYHYWCCMSLISAVLEDRVWYEFYKDDPLYPNMFIMLIGPSGVSKGLAIGSAVRLLEKSDHVTIKYHRGPATAPFVLDLLCGDVKKDDADYIDTSSSSNLWLVMDELSHDVDAGGPVMVRRFLKMMTELYTGQYRFDAGTRGEGLKSIENACVTWLSGTTLAWLKDVLTRDMVDSGFTPRVLPVVHGYVDEKVIWPEYPDDRDFIYDHLKARLYELRNKTGPFVLSPQAKGAYEEWYGDREAPDDDVARAFFQRERALMFKIAMILAAMDPGPMVVTKYHVELALHHVRYASQWHDYLVESANATPESEDIEIVRNVIHKWKEIGHSHLLRLVQRKLNSERVKRAMRDLIQRKEVTQDVGPKGGVRYVWVGAGE